MSEGSADAPIILICAQRGLFRHASIGVQIGGFCAHDADQRQSLSVILLRAWHTTGSPIIFCLLLGDIGRWRARMSRFCAVPPVT
jgi:hypothetical protein